tara:strand:- start:1060 stop:1608 length:549 start_codon:yes stop_codon:yes gene_type:complete
MAKISNITAYPTISNLDGNDYLIITDANNSLATKTVTLSQIQSFLGLVPDSAVVANVSVSSATLLTLATTPATLVAAPGANKVLDIVSIMCYMDAGGTAYDFTPNLQIKIGTESIGSISNGSNAMNSAVDATFKPETPNSTTEIIAPNTALTLHAGGSNPTQGTGVLFVNVFYRVLTLGSSF